jgi:metal-responsive CopG/Arc/MetJ family transcriptional regulator
MKHTVAAIFDDDQLAQLDELVREDSSNRGAVIRKAVRQLHERNKGSLFLPEPARNQSDSPQVSE